MRQAYRLNLPLVHPQCTMSNYAHLSWYPLWMVLITPVGRDSIQIGPRKISPNSQEDHPEKKSPR